MGNSVAMTFNIKNTGRTFTINVEKNSENIVKSLVSVTNSNEITQKDAEKLQNIAKRNGDFNVLEQSDLAPEEKLAMANINGYNKPYELSLVTVGGTKCLQVKVRKTKWYYPNPQLKTIKADFGLPNGLLVRKGEIPYGNEDVIGKRAVPGSTPDGRNTDYDVAELEAGDVINIPIEQVKINDSPKGFWGRPWF